jgi:hypothetical protein
MRIYAAFPFDGELTLLEHLLRETWDLIDAYVLIEAGETYRGTPKAFVFAEKRSDFAWAEPRIRHVRLPRLGTVESAPRARAEVQRNAVRLALADAAPDDVVLLLDVDEVPSRGLLERLRRDGLARPHRLQMTRHYGFADRLGPASPCCAAPDAPFATAHRRHQPGPWDALDPRWHGLSAVAAPVAALQREGAFALRYGLAPEDVLVDAGRHYSSVDPSTRLERKLARVFHAEFDGTRERSAAHLERCRAWGMHHRGWWYPERPTGALPDDVARLLDRCPTLAAPPAPAAWRRRTLRSWSWLRLSRALPDRLVNAIDTRFDALTLLLAPPLLLVDGGRALAASIARSFRLRSRPSGHFN